MRNYKSIKLFPSENLDELQNEYGFGSDGFVFASCNDDPIFFQNGKIYTSPHGTNDIKIELLADSFADFLVAIQTVQVIRRA